MDLVLPVQALGRFDVSDELTRFSGQDPSRFQKATFLAATRDRRIQMAVRTHAANIRRAAAELPTQLQAIACDDTPDAQGAPRDPGVARQGDGPEHAGGRERRRQDHQRFVDRFDAGDVACAGEALRTTCAAAAGRATPS